MSAFDISSRAGTFTPARRQPLKGKPATIAALKAGQLAPADNPGHPLGVLSRTDADHGKTGRIQCSLYPRSKEAA